MHFPNFHNNLHNFSAPVSKRKLLVLLQSLCSGVNDTETHLVSTY